MEGLATGKMLATSSCNNFTELGNLASSSSSRVTPTGAVSFHFVKIRSRTPFLGSGTLEILCPRPGIPNPLRRSVQCCKEDDDHRESESSENTEQSSNSSHCGGEEILGRHSSRASDGVELKGLRRENSELPSSLTALSQSLASISEALAEVARAVQLVANAVDCRSPSENGDVAVEPPAAVEGAGHPLESTSKEEFLPSISSHEVSEIQGIEDPVQAQLLEQNLIAHKLAYKIQQAFFQARIEGLGKPFQLAAEDFVATCLEAHTMGTGLKELQLQLILLEGSLTGAFGIRNQRYKEDRDSVYVMSEESRVRSSWIRLVYSTLAEVKERRSRLEHGADEVGKERKQPDASETFVKQLVRVAFEEGYDLDRVKLEQNVPSSAATSGAVKTMRQSTYLVLLTLQKTTSDAL